MNNGPMNNPGGTTPIAFDNSYARLPEHFFARQPPSHVSSPSIIRVNSALAAQLGIDADWLASPAGIQMVAGNQNPPGADPISTVYAGFQFGNWNPQLGDGRAHLLGEVVGPDNVRYDIQLKGSGPTPYSRGGDGRAPLGPVLREYIVSEAMAAMGVPTTRTLAAVATGDIVQRDEPQPGGVLARVAQSHIRIGTFQYFSSIQDVEALQLLAEHVIDRHYPHCRELDNPYLGLLEAVIEHQAELIAKWQLLGFIHGVMNTDNMLLSGETVDYGPCAFMDAFDPATVFSSIDHAGRYAYQNQPGIANWNLATLAQAMLPLLDANRDAAVAMAQQAVDGFAPLFVAAYQQGMGNKLGLQIASDETIELMNDLLGLMRASRSDFTLTFRYLTDLAGDQDEHYGYHPGDGFDDWVRRWQPQLDEQAHSRMVAANPLYIPRNHLVEDAIEAAVYRADLGPFHRLVEITGKPYGYDPALERFAMPAPPGQSVRQTFCGT
ncbi:MAG: YdiU family protein [Proteobacteria bacterium]|nr:YdiU family protein [Pseudomonadota bacterium]